jgi:hypothetical protein
VGSRRPRSKSSVSFSLPDFARIVAITLIILNLFIKKNKTENLKLFIF